MGYRMAQNLAKKFPGGAGEILVYDVDKNRITALAADCAAAAGSSGAATGAASGGVSGAVPAHVVPAADLAELGSKADIVFLSLPTSEIVREVVLGRGGLSSALKKGSILADTSTTEVTVIKSLAAELAKLGIEFADTPVSGGEKGAADGTLAFMIGAAAPVFAAIQPYCAAMGASVVHMGAVGAGQITKAVNQMIVGATFTVIAESFSLGVKNGLDAKTIYEAIKGGWAGSKVLDVAAADMLSREFKPGGTVDIHWKDLGYALSLSKDTDVPVPVTALVHEVFKAARARGDNKKSQSVVVKLWEDLLGQEVK
jgi:2-hydroxy-3-oxopropionate reductase